MKCLKIEDNQGWCLGDDGQFKSIESIDKSDLMFLLDKAIDGEFEMDPFDEAAIGHAAHRVIYRDIHERFLEFLKNTTRFKDESEQIYRAAFEKYQNTTAEN